MENAAQIYSRNVKLILNFQQFNLQHVFPWQAIRNIVLGKQSFILSI
jgi:hypothetical protein